MTYDPFQIWSYTRPKKGSEPRKRWRGEAVMVTEWAYAPLSPCGTFYDLSKKVIGFASADDAWTAALAKRVPKALKTRGTFYTV